MPSLSLMPDENTLRELLAATDEFAVETVRAGRGGPFGASLYVYNMRTGALTPVLSLRANAVLATGMASAHAEDQALSPDMIAALERELEGRDPSETCVIMSSSGESCPACHTKEEMAARYLAAKGLLLPGHFIVTYGATYGDTLKVAGFNDEPYALDLRKPAAERMIGTEILPLNDAPVLVRMAFAQAHGPLAIVELPGNVVVHGSDLRAGGDLMATPEMTAIRNASTFQKESQSRTPFDLDQATLWTGTLDLSPLAYTTGQWGNVQKITRVAGIPNAHRMQTQDAPGTSNTELFRIVTQPYNDPGSMIQVVHLTPFANRAQHAWRNKDDRVQYNGVAAP